MKKLNILILSESKPSNTLIDVIKSSGHSYKCLTFKTLHSTKTP